MVQESLGRESFIWAVGSLCALHRIPFDAELLLRRFPPPYDTASLQQAALAYGFKVALETLPVQNIHPAVFPVLALLRPIKGGDGVDVYQFSGTYGTDVITDTDGQGIILIGGDANSGGTPLQGGKQIGDNRVHRDASDHLYVQVDVNTLVIDGNIIIKNYTAGSGALSLTMTGPEADVNPVITRTIVGDLKPIDFDLTAEGVQTELDELGNIKTAGADPNRDDTLYDSAGNDLVQGLGGDDTLLGNKGGDDHFEGGAGQDAVLGYDGNDVIEGGAGSDVLGGGHGDDRVYANMVRTVEDAYTVGETQAGTGKRGDLLDDGDGENTLIGDAGNDIIAGGMGKDIIVGMGGDDNIEGDANGLTILGSWNGFTKIWGVTRTVTTQGGVTLYTRAYNFNLKFDDTSAAGDMDVIYAGAGKDWVMAGGGNDFVDAGEDNDVVFGGAGNDIILGLAGDDVLTGDSAHPHLDASLHGNDYLNGGEGKDVLYGEGGSDYLEGGEGNDSLVGDSQNVPAQYQGNDYLDGGNGDDQLSGGGGDDILIGGAGTDTLIGGNGNDTYIINAGDGVDHIVDDFATPGANTIRFGVGINQADIKLRQGSLMLDLGGGNDVHIEGFNYNDVFNTVGIGSFQFADGSSLTAAELLARGFDLDGTENIDVISGTNTTDRINGFAGDDQLGGKDGNDIINGEAGNDVLDGGDGNDALDGGLGNGFIAAGTGQIMCIQQQATITTGG